MKIIYENQNIPKKLEQSIKDNNSIHQYFDINFNGIKPKNYCGFITLKNKSYFIAPKISKKENQNLDIFIYMLIYAYDIKLSNEDLLNIANNKHKIFEVFIRFFTDNLLNEFKKGIYKKYITLEDNLKVLRGKYLIDKNLANAYHQNIYCEFDEFSMDNELNRFFLFTIKTFMKFSNYSNLHKCEMILDEVTYKNIDFNRLNIHFDRMNDRYKKSYKIALMILNKIIPITDNSNTDNFAFLFDMAEVFEKFIGNIYKDIDKTTQLQTQKDFGNLRLKPDIIFKDTIIDTKYKIVQNKNDLSTQDKYQMFVYGTNFNITNTMLLYPKHFTKSFKDEYLLLGKDSDTIKLKMKSINLDSNKSFIKYIKTIKKRILGISK